MQQRRDTSANWTAVNPILGAGEIGVESDTGKFKIGDGSSLWSALAYAGGGGGGLDIPASSGEALVFENGAWVAGPYIGGAATTYNASIYDPYWDKVLWLYDFTSGTQGGVDFSTADKKGELPFTLTPAGAGAYSTDQVKWGTSSVYLNNTYLTSSPTITYDTVIGKPGSTLDCWVWVTAAATSFSFAGSSGGGNTAYWWYQGGKLELYIYNTTVISQTYTFPREQWVYVACVIYDNGNEAAIYVNNTRVAYWSGTAAVVNMNASNPYLQIGSSGLGYAMKGYMSEIRYTRAVRYSGTSITVPTAKFPTQGIPTTDTRYALEHHENVDTTVDTLVNGSSLVYLSAEDKWLSGPPVGRVEPVGDPFWANVKKYLPFDQTPISTNYGSDTTTTLGGTAFNTTNVYYKGDSPVGGRGFLSSYHNTSGDVYVEYANFPFGATESWCVDFWFHLSSSWVSANSQSIPLFNVAETTDTTNTVRYTLYLSKYGSQYNLVAYTNDANLAYTNYSYTYGVMPYNKFPTDQWVHIACVYDYPKNLVRVFVNGVEHKYMTLALFSNYTLGGAKRVRFMQSNVSFQNHKVGVSDFRITTGTKRYFNPSNPDDQLYKFKPVVSRPLQASTGAYRYVKDTSADFIKYNTPPTTATTAGKLGDIRFDTSYVYICIAPDTWKRVAIASW